MSADQPATATPSLPVRRAKSAWGEARETLRLGGPLAIGELGWMSTYIVDALMIGHLPNSPLAISASSLGNTIFYAVVFGAIYMLNGLETLVAQAAGVGDEQECVHLLAQSLWFVAVGTPVVILLTLGGLWLLPHAGTPADIVAETALYVHPLLWSTLPLMLYMALRRFLQSVDNVLWITLSLVTASLVNWVGDRALLFGHMGFHPMGIAGSAWATVGVRLWMLLLVTVGAWRVVRARGFALSWDMLQPSARRLKALAVIGWPSALENFTELGFSSYMSVLCARLGTVLLAAHQVVLDLNAFVYQVPAGLSYATIVRVGQGAGRDDGVQVRRAANVSLVIGLGFMTVAATLFAVFAHFWAGLYTNSAQVAVAAVPIFTICAAILMADTTFVILAAALTGLGDTRTPMLISLFWTWAIGMPLAYWLAFHAGMQLRGLWWGRAVGSIGAALTETIVWRWRLRRTSGRLSLLPVVTGTPDMKLTLQS